MPVNPQRVIELRGASQSWPAIGRELQISASTARSIYLEATAPKPPAGEAPQAVCMAIGKIIYSPRGKAIAEALAVKKKPWE